ncbi:MAG: preprotein translocase subunit SecD [Gammaproteobacteria bacterium SG8_47]|nr:MAG: preprotein translocase subunit SecD [Gammaproteobacteria bacterium SG8_47]
MNKYPLWKYLLIAVILTAGALYAAPNLYGDDPALQVSATPQTRVDETTQKQAAAALDEAGIAYRSTEMNEFGLLIRFNDVESQLRANERLRITFGEQFTVALNLASAAPKWMQSINALPMYLGLDLRGGLHFLLEVDTETAVRQAMERYADDVRTLLREKRIRYASIIAEPQRVRIELRNPEERGAANDAIRAEFGELQLSEDDAEPTVFTATLREPELRELRKQAVKQNITTLRNRVNEVGVAEPVIQQQGEGRIVVQLPGLQDSARAKRILSATASLEFRLVDIEHSLQEAVQGRVPITARLYRERNGNPVLLKKRVIITGDQITNASAGFDSQSGQPAVFVNLDGTGARIMQETTKANLKKPMAVVFIEDKAISRLVDGKEIVETKRIEEVINVATIQSVFSKRFQITGLDSPEESRDLALLLRAGALAAPIRIVEERTIGPSLGKDNIDQGFRSVVIGFVLVLAFMTLWYRGFGLVANLALFLNLALLIAVLSMLQATLTLPGIAGIVLTVGMAVDANVLIFERIREELRAGNTPQASIAAGYDKALSTIADANITTLIAAVTLFVLGTGPIKGFAVTLSIGIVMSMFTAIMVTRAVVNLFVGNRRLNKLSI